MSDRREFLKTLGGGAAGTWLLSSSLSALSQPARKEIRIGGQRATIVDIHAHCIFPAVADFVPLGGDAANFGYPGLDLGPERLVSMDQRGIDIQALSVNAYWWYQYDRGLASRVVSTHDAGIASWSAAHPGRFVGLTSPALQFPELAAEQLERAVTELGHRGASIGGHVLGEPPTSEKYDPFWAKAVELDVPVFMHPNNSLNIVRQGGLAGRGNLDNIVGNPLETTVFLTHMIFDGTLDRFPDLKLCAAHGGGYLPSYLGRTEVACHIRNNANCANKREPSDYLRDQIYVDTMVFSEEGLRHLVAETGVSQVVYGSDQPYNWPDTIDIVADSPSLSNRDKLAILGGNLIDLLRI